MSLTTAIFVLGVVIFTIGFQLLDRVIKRMTKKERANSKRRRHRH